MRLCELQDMQVLDVEGHVLGRVFEFRSPGRAETEPLYPEREIRTLLYGDCGLLERLGWKIPQLLQIPWSHVHSIEARSLRVTGRREDYLEGAR